ncbi:MAG: hypothetical protein CMM74_04315 [Rhodospirillaceae bacterium]|jgi:uncharacterized membrane protein YozB (DUF420 family)|nr:hypothetical protein [Rhodospirillaceae bacterium]
MIEISILPHLNAALNAIAGGVLTAGFIFIKTGNRRAHKISMILAMCVSGVFLISYVTLRAYAPIFEFQGQGAVRVFYYIMLISHVFLATAIVPLVIFSVLHAFKSRFAAHKRITRWTWPVWIYVSISGIGVYLMLYQFYPAAAG